MTAEELAALASYCKLAAGFHLHAAEELEDEGKDAQPAHKRSLVYRGAQRYYERQERIERGVKW